MLTTAGRCLRCAIWCTAFALGPLGYAHESESDEHDEGDVARIDHAVPHFSTVGANAGEWVRLFVRERVRKDQGDDRERDYGEHHRRKAVLMVHGRSFPALSIFDFGHDDYNWALQLARAGFDVFIVDLQGSGRSPLPNRSIPALTDPCNVTTAEQQLLLVPNPLLGGTCPEQGKAPSFPFLLINSQSEWDEVDTVVEYIRVKRGVQKVALIGVSRGSLVVGPYTVQHPEKVESLFMQGPIFNPNAPLGIGPDGLAPPVKLVPLPGGSTKLVACTRADVIANLCPGVSSSVPLLLAGIPMTLNTRQAFMDRWNREIQCPDQSEEGVLDRGWRAILRDDELGRMWGPPPAGAPPDSPPEGVMRNRSFFPWGWTPATAHKVSVPTLLIFGEKDTEGTAEGFPVAVNTFLLYDKLPQDVPKLLFKVACAGHLMVWEHQRKVLHRISTQWLKHGAVEGFTNGQFVVDWEGNLVPIP